MIVAGRRAGERREAARGNRRAASWERFDGVGKDPGVTRSINELARRVHRRRNWRVGNVLADSTECARGRVNRVSRDPVVLSRRIDVPLQGVYRQEEWAATQQSAERRALDGGERARVRVDRKPKNVGRG